MREEVLKRARDTYGNSNQILVAIEELSELASILAKFPRYDCPDIARTDLHDRVVDEVADVLIVLHHVKSIFKLDSKEVYDRVDAKILRLERWLDKSDSMNQTTLDREV